MPDTVRRLALLVAPLLALTTAAPAALAAHGALGAGGPVTGGSASVAATLVGASDDGQVVAFSTTESLVAGDGDAEADLYVRRGGADPVLLTPGNASGVEFDTANTQVLGDGDVLVVTLLPLSASDVDQAQDVYLARRDGTLVLVSQSQVSSASVGVPTATTLASEDGSTIVFTTNEQLVSIDDGTGSATPDVYAYSGGVLRLVTPGVSQGTATGVSPSGSRIYWESNISQPPESTSNGSRDLYYKDGNAGPASPTVVFGGGGGSGTPLFAGQSPDGTTIVVRTALSYTGGDATAGSIDLYAFRGVSVPQLVTGTGSAANAAPTFLRACDGGAVVFASDKPLAGDTDAADDVFRATAATTTRLSSGTGVGAGALAQAVSADCSRLAWVTSGAEVAGDTDGLADLYVASDGGTPTLVSTPPVAGADGSVVDTGYSRTPLGSRLTFSTSARLTAADADGVIDVYQSDGGALTLLSSATTASPSDQRAAAVSADGSVVLVSTTEALQGDADAASDLYRYALTADAGPGGGGEGSTPPGGGGGTSTTPPPPGGGITPKLIGPSLKVSKAGIRVSVKKGIATIVTRTKATCPAGGGACTLTVTTKGNKRTFQKVRATIAAGKSATVSVKLSKKSYKRLRKAKKLKLAFSITVAQTGRPSATGSFTATVKAPRR